MCNSMENYEDKETEEIIRGIPRKAQWDCSLLLQFYLFIYLAVLSLCCCSRFSAVEVSGGCSVAVVCGLLATVAAQTLEPLRFSNWDTT